MGWRLIPPFFVFFTLISFSMIFLNLSLYFNSFYIFDY
jgi:hypothetical protein